MKRTDLERHLHEQGCLFLREGGRHTIWWNPGNRKVSSIPRHREVNDFTTRKICRDLEVTTP